MSSSGTVFVPTLIRKRFLMKYIDQTTLEIFAMYAVLLMGPDISPCA